MDPAEIRQTTPCGACKYDLKGLPVDGVCPECGAKVVQTVPWCPRCRTTDRVTSALARVTLHETELWLCGRCGGMGFERDSLRRAVANIPPERRLHPGRTVHDAAQQSPAACPRCETRMWPIVIDPATLIDRCLTCGLVWLDEKELPRVAAYVKELMGHRRMPPNLDELLGNREALQRAAAAPSMGRQAAEILGEPFVLAVLLELLGGLFS